MDRTYADAAADADYRERCRREADALAARFERVLEDVNRRLPQVERQVLALSAQQAAHERHMGGAGLPAASGQHPRDVFETRARQLAARGMPLKEAIRMASLEHVDGAKDYIALGGVAVTTGLVMASTTVDAPDPTSASARLNALVEGRAAQLKAQGKPVDIGLITKQIGAENPDLVQQFLAEIHNTRRIA
jgi:hypothetical protein